MSKTVWCLSVLLAWMGSELAPAASPGEEVVVVYNSRMRESKVVAEYYARQRQIPASQIFGYGLTTNEAMSRKDFREDLQNPLAKALESKRLWHVGKGALSSSLDNSGRVVRKVIESKIRYLVLCYGVPLKIEPDPALLEPIPENLRPELRRNEAAVDSELAVLPLLEVPYLLTANIRNLLYGATNAASLHPTNGVLMVARLDGPSGAIARGLVDRAIQAETDGLWGRAYFDCRHITETNSYKLGDDMIRNASEMARRAGFETVVDEQPETFPPGFPMSQIGLYVGWYEGNVSGPFTRPKVEFMPGAIAYHLHSFSGASVRDPAQFWVGPFLAKGATAVMGSVYEPYLSGTPDMAIFINRILYHKFTFGEAAYTASSVLSWQTTVVGDPLYRPFGTSLPDRHEKLLARHSPLLEWSFLDLVNTTIASSSSTAKAALYLDQLELTHSSPVLTEKLADLYATLGKPSSAVFAANQALKLNPSPMQRLRLRLTLGERLAALNQDAEAYADYEELLREFPDYPDKLGVYRRMLPLAQKLDKKADAERFERELNPPKPEPPPGATPAANTNANH